MKRLFTVKELETFKRNPRKRKLVLTFLTCVFLSLVTSIITFYSSDKLSIAWPVVVTLVSFFMSHVHSWQDGYEEGKNSTSSK